MQLTLSSLASRLKRMISKQLDAIISLLNLWLLVAGINHYWLPYVSLLVTAFGILLGFQLHKQLFAYQLSKWLQWMMPIALIMISSNASWSWVFHLYIASIVVALTILIMGRLFQLEQESKINNKWWVIPAIIISIMITGVAFVLPKNVLLVALVTPLIHTCCLLRKTTTIKLWIGKITSNFPWHIALLLIGLWLLPIPFLLPYLIIISAVIWYSSKLSLEVFSVTFPILLVVVYYAGLVITPLQTLSLEYILSDYGWISAFMIINFTVTFYQAQPKVVYRNKTLSREIEITDYPLKNSRKLLHNGIVHSVQLLDPNYPMEGCRDYYHQDGPWGEINRVLHKNNLKKWLVLGLGAGSLLPHASKAQEVTVLELDHEVIKLAKNPRYFSFIKNAQAKVEVINAEGRSYVDNMPADEKYDAIILDAYSGRNVPGYLLTMQALTGYCKHIKKGGVLIVHITGMKKTARHSLSANLKSLGLEAKLLTTLNVENKNENNQLPFKRWADNLANKFLTKQQVNNLLQILGIRKVGIESFNSDWILIKMGRAKDVTKDIQNSTDFVAKYPPATVVEDGDVGYVSV